MDIVVTIINWTYKALATWYAAALIGGVLMMFADRRDRRREPSDEDVRHAAALYREYYGSEAHRIIGDHMLAASFAPDGRYRRFLRRVSVELFASLVTDSDHFRAIDS